jgi:hypothetical protein
MIRVFSFTKNAQIFLLVAPGQKITNRSGLFMIFEREALTALRAREFFRPVY